MKKRLCAMLLAVCLLFAALPASGLAEQSRFRNMSDLVNWLYYDCAYMLADEIEFGYTQSMDNVFNGVFPMEMLYSSGMGQMDVSIDRTYRRVKISNIDYYPGFKAAQAWELEMVHLLDEDERTLLARAEAMVEEACRYAQSPYQVLVNLHNALIKRVTFTVGETEFEYRDTAIGALIYGQAECDGYADAFYLLCTLAGFPVRMITGQAGNESIAESGGHMWNLVWMDTGWYHVDASWDDLDYAGNSSMTTYRYFLMGSSMMNIYHWDDSQLVSQPAPYTDWNACYYTSDGTGITYGAYYKTLEDAANYAAYMQRSFDQDMIHVMIDGNCEGQYDRINQALINGGLSGSWWVWAHKVGEYTCIAICIDG